MSSAGRLPRVLLLAWVFIIGLLMAAGSHGFSSVTPQVGQVIAAGAPAAAASTPDVSAVAGTEHYSGSGHSDTGRGGSGQGGPSQGAHEHHVEEQGQRGSAATAVVVLVRSRRRLAQQVQVRQSRRWRPGTGRGPPRPGRHGVAQRRVRLHVSHCVFLV